MVSQTAPVDSRIDREQGLSECRYLSQLDIPQNEMDPQLEAEEEEKEEDRREYPVMAGRLLLRIHR